MLPLDSFSLLFFNSNKGWKIPADRFEKEGWKNPIWDVIWVDRDHLLGSPQIDPVKVLAAVKEYWTGAVQS